MDHASLQVRIATRGDTENLTVLKQQVWIATYADQGIRSDLSAYVLTHFTPKKIKEALSDPLRINLLLEKRKHLIGAVEILLENNCPVDKEDFPELTNFYILEKFCGQGYGEILLNEALHLIREKEYPGVWLSVYHLNTRAIRFYQKHGFSIEGITYFEMNNQQFENKVMVRCL